MKHHVKMEYNDEVYFTLKTSQDNIKYNIETRDYNGQIFTFTLISFRNMAYINHIIAEIAGR